MLPNNTRYNFNHDHQLELQDMRQIAMRWPLDTSTGVVVTHSLKNSTTLEYNLGYPICLSTCASRY